MSRRILVVDDSETFRQQACSMLEADGWEVIGEASTGAHALRETMRLRPDVALLDVQLPDINGFEVAKRITSARPGIAIVMTSARDARFYRAHLQSAGAPPFLPKLSLSGAALATLLESR